MNPQSILSFVKQSLPRPVRRMLRAALNYLNRVGCWVIVLWQVRGSTWRDQLTLFSSALASPAISLRNLMQWQDPLLLTDATVNVRGVGQFILRGRCDDLWHVLPWREQSIMETIRSRLSPGDVFVDAGANIGIYTVLASRLVGPTGEVVAVEMIPDTADRLEDHVRINGLKNITVVRHALSDVSGRIVTATVQDGKFGQATIAEDSERYGLGSRVQVTSTTLDDIVEGVPFIALMKMDLEGAELQALRGAAHTLTRVRAVIYENRGLQPQEDDSLNDFFIEAGFHIHTIDGNNGLAVRESA